MNQEFWNNRYALDEYVYGKEPNQFFKEQLEKLCKGKLLLPAEGEGRNAVFAAKLGFQVVAFDMSREAKNKALKLAHHERVEIDYIHADIDDIDFLDNQFDYIALIYAHFPADKRKKYHQRLIQYLKPGGKLLLEGFSVEQLHYDSGGPQNKAMLFTEDFLLNDFKSLKNIEIQSRIVQLNEGALHLGEAAVIQLAGIK